MQKKKPEPDWKQFGQYVSMKVTLFTTVRDTLDAMGVGVAEALAWAVGEGKKTLADEFIRPLGERVLAARPKPVITVVMVDLGAFPKKPSSEFSVEDHQGTGLVPLEKRTNGLYLNGRKIVLTQFVRQLGGKTITGYGLRDEQTGKPVLNANVLHALLEYPELFPDAWKTDELGRIRFIYFWGTIYKLDRRLCVRYACFNGDGWVGSHRWLDDDFSEQSWWAVLAS